LYCKGKGKFHPITGHESPKGEYEYSYPRPQLLNFRKDSFTSGGEGEEGVGGGGGGGGGEEEEGKKKKAALQML
jgi:hypothetical protein